MSKIKTAFTLSFIFLFCFTVGAFASCGKKGGYTGNMLGVWGKGLSGEMNVTLAFSLDFGEEKDFEMKLAAANCYRVYVDGEFVAFGPQRAAHGYARVAEYKTRGKRIVAEVNCVNVQNFCWVKQQPFFACEVNSGERTYDASDFTCYRLTDRVRKVQRYSYQRGFAEVYSMLRDRSSLYTGNPSFKKIRTERVDVPELLPSYVDEAKYNLHEPVSVVDEGAVSVDKNAPVWRDRAHDIGNQVEGYKISSWECSATDEVSEFVYESGKTGKTLYKTFDFGRAITGFTELEVKAKNAGNVYVVFDEILWPEAGKGEKYVSFYRNTCSSVHKWEFKNAGEFSVTSFEPYTVRYALVIYDAGMEVSVRQRDYENPNTDRFSFSSSDERINKIVEAARNTLAQNSVDILTDCPSRERAGWLSDGWFSSVAERAFTGENSAEKAFLENYALSSKKNLPEGMVPMCYPSDPFDTFIPNWAMWYILEVAKYARAYGSDGIVDMSKENIFGIIKYFEGFENEYGVLEDLTGWVFVEWSAANDADHICGVNVPSNMCYAKCLDEAADLYGVPEWKTKAEKIWKFIVENAFDGEFFADNLLRKGGSLVQSGLKTEVCQYYAFWFDCVKKEDYPELYAELMNKLGNNRAAGYRPEIAESNVFYGLYMRIDLLMRDGEREKVLDECLRLFLPMAERTGTLWEHNGIYASCNHGFASYAVKWIVWALTGYDCMNGGDIAAAGVGADCEITLPVSATENIRLSVKNNEVGAER